MERYKDYKIPVVSLKAGRALKTFGLTDSALIAPAKAVEQLQGEPGLVTLSGKEETLVGEKNADELDELVDASAPDGKAQAALESKFVNVTDLLPPLPKKGSFNVETIKKSLYFFS